MRHQPVTVASSMIIALASIGLMDTYIAVRAGADSLIALRSNQS